MVGRRLNYAASDDENGRSCDDRQRAASEGPTSSHRGFEPREGRAARDMVSGLRSLGVTVFLTIHYMEEAEHLADRVAVISEGLIVAEGAPGTLAGRGHAPAPDSLHPPVDRGPGRPARRRPASSERRNGDRVLQTSSPLEILCPHVRWAEEIGFDLADLEVKRPSLEDVYLAGREDEERATSRKLSTEGGIQSEGRRSRAVLASPPAVPRRSTARCSTENGIYDMKHRTLQRHGVPGRFTPRLGRRRS